MRFTKMQGTGNDFVVVETADAQADWSRQAIALCDRHYGVGADGLLLLMPSQIADFRMRIFNADGSEANACGNGIRCLVKYFVDRRPSQPKSGSVSVETLVGVRRAEIFPANGTVSRVKISMGEPKFAEEEIPVLLKAGGGQLLDIRPIVRYSMIVSGRKLELNLVSMGNPHAVYFTRGSVSDFPLLRIGPKVERHPMFPRGVNFEVAHLVSRNQIEARVWEHGVGETLACGSGACAITVAACQHGYVDSKVEIRLPGGTLEVEWDSAGEVFLCGPAETVFTGEWPDGSQSKLGY
jgi:diaminopimelate epimerase